MAIELNHTIVRSRDKARAAAFVAHLLGRPEPTCYGPFMVVALDNRVSLDYYEAEGPFVSQHYAFLVPEAEFDRIFERIQQRGIAYYADPAKSRRSEINRNDGGRGCYFDDLDGHLLEIITRPYGGL